MSSCAKVSIGFGASLLAVGAVLLGSEAAVGCEATVAAYSAMTEVTGLSHLRSTQLHWRQSVLAPGYAAWGV